MDRAPRPPHDLARSWSLRVRVTLGVMIVAYLPQIVWPGQLDSLFALSPLGNGFEPWQPLTYTLVQGTPISAVIGWVMLFFFMDTAHECLGTRRFWTSTFITWAIATFGSLMAGLTGWLQPGAVSGPFWWLDAMLVWFALTNRGAQVRWMMVLPLKAEVVAWLVGLLSLLNLAAYRDVNSAHLVFAWLAAWATTWLDGGSFRRWKLGRRKRAIEKELTKFQVLEGGKDHDRPRRQKPSDYTN